jgi:hypothetical protein
MSQLGTFDQDPAGNATRGAAVTITAAVVIFLALAGNHAWAFPNRPQPAAALVSQKTRLPAYNDFLRLIFANLNPPPTTLGAPSAYRVFFGATAFYRPPITIAQIATFSGIPVNSSVSLFAIRCMPPADSQADPALAMWPNVISRMLTDYEANPPTPDTPDEAIQTIASTFEDFKSPVLTEPLENALEVGKQFFEDFPQSGPPQFTAAQMQQQVARRFGMFTAFTGLGYAAAGTGASPSLDSAQAIQSMVIPDFILKNVTLAEAGCYCVELPPTIRNRDQRKLDPSFILRNGGNGSCVTVDRLPYSGGEE